MRARLMIVGLMVLMMFPGLALAGSRTDTKDYVLGLDALIVTCNEPPGNVGGVCFEMAGDELTVDLSIEDDAGWEVGAIYEFHDSTGAVGSGLFCGSVENVEVPNTATELLIFLHGAAIGPIGCLADNSTGNATTGRVTATYETGVRAPAPAPVDAETDCQEFVPHDASVKGVTDDGRNISLDVAVLLDGVDQSVAEAAFDVAAERSYAALGITLNPVSFETVSFTGNDAGGMNRQAKAHFGGERPAGSDVVYTITNKDITDAVLGDGVAGLADCIGGVEIPSRAFAVGEIVNSFNIGPTKWYLYGTAKVVAHEIGHLMGAHHHYANCIEGIPTELTEGEASACTLMSNFVDFDSLNFSVLNAAVVRAHATEYAAP